MHRASIALLLVAACGTTTDDRPETAAFVTAAILAPNCGRASCHASGTASHGFVFDTIGNALPSLRELVVPGNAAGSELIDVLTRSHDIMPPDQPLPDVDIALLTRWIDDGADGL
jgi:hypothetical protein